MVHKLLSTSLGVILRVFNRLTQPLIPDLSKEDELHVRAVSGIMLALMVFAMPVFTLIILFADEWDGNRIPNIFMRVGIILLLWLLYSTARRGHHRAVSILAIILITPVMVIISLLAAYPHNLVLLQYLTLAAIYAIIMMSARIVLINCIFQVGVLLALPLISDMALHDIVAGPLIFNVVAALLVIGMQNLRQQVREYQKAVLAESEKRYRIISELISDYAYAFRVEPDGTMVNEWMTDSFCRVTGYEWDEIKGRGLTPVTHPDDIERVRTALEQTLKGEANTDEYRIITKNGDLRWIQVYRRPEWNAEHTRVLRFYGVAKDVTDTRMAREQQVSREVENARITVIDQFVAAISHDFRTSLATIETSSYLIERRLPEDQREVLANKLSAIHDNVQRMNQQLENLQTVTSLNTLETVPTDINALVRDLLYEMGTPYKPVEIKFRATEGLPPVTADTTEIQRAVKKLLDNAIAFTPEDGIITVRTAQCMAYVIVEVADTGPGIADEHLPHIFDMFYRGDEARSIKKGGIGLGLSIARMVAEAHNGKIRVRTSPGGSTFTLELPIAKGINQRELAVN